MFSDAILVQIFSDDRLNGIPLEYQSIDLKRFRKRQKTTSLTMSRGCEEGKE